MAVGDGADDEQAKARALGGAQAVWSPQWRVEVKAAVGDITDIGPSAAHIFASLALFRASAGAARGLDTGLRPCWAAWPG
ncbi:hypothetical protein ACIRVF_30190 [Kitasatospora sp. NPDC101157]|uniref:hypothetical protein n=1 Tax=Kitasatospora sp. NPDC101157 TaxID=3364098 RepID=UPI003814730D